MKFSKLFPLGVVLFTVGLWACSNQPKAPDVTGRLRASLDQAGFNDVKVSQDRDKGVITLSGDVPSDNDKSQAESIARSMAGSQVLANQIAVRHPGEESTEKKVDADLDKSIEKNVDAVLVKHKMKKNVNYEVKSGVVTLTGKVGSQSERTKVEELVTSLPNVRQVVNEVEVKGQKATSSD